MNEIGDDNGHENRHVGHLNMVLMEVGLHDEPLMGTYMVHLVVNRKFNFFDEIDIWQVGMKEI
jgi:hypothetical protein